MERRDTAEASSLGLCGGRDKQDVECFGAQRRSTELRFQGGSLCCGEREKALSLCRYENSIDQTAVGFVV